MMSSELLGRETQDRIREILREDVTHPLVWCALPRLEKLIARAELRENAKVLRQSPGRVLLPKRRKPKPFARYSLAEGTLRVHKTENETLAVGGSSTDPELVTADHWGSERRALGWGRYRRLLLAEKQLGLERGSFLADVFRGVLYLKAASSLMNDLRPERLLHAGQEHIFARAFALAARLRNVPTVLVPHAPTALGTCTHDLAADWFLARGDADSEFFGALGAKREQIVVVGDPAIHDLEPAHPSSSVVMVALYGDSEAQSVDIVLQVAKALDVSLEDVVLAPHPRNRPHAWNVAARLGISAVKGRTLAAVIERRPRVFVCTYGSGVRLEVEAVGVPTISLDTRYYAFEESLPAADRLGDAESLSRQVAEQSGRFPEQRIQESRRWIASFGFDARDRREEQLAAIISSPGPVLDSWGLT